MGYICLHWRLPPCKNHGIYNEFCIQSIYRPSLLVDIINLIDLNIIIPWFLNGELTYKWTPYMEVSSMDGGSSSIRCNSEQFKWPQSWHGTMPSFTAVYSRSILIYKMDTNETDSCMFVGSGNPRQGYRRYIFGNGSRAFVGLSMTFLCTGGVEVLLPEWHYVVYAIAVVWWFRTQARVVSVQ